MSRTRPDWLPYRSRDGVYETHFVKHTQGFTQVLNEVLEWSVTNTGSIEAATHTDFRIIDSFLSDSLGPDTVAEMFRKAFVNGIQVRILLADPMSAFASARAATLYGKDSPDPPAAIAERESKIGIQRLVLGLAEAVGQAYRETDVREWGLEQLLKTFGEIGATRNIHLRFYDSAPGGPMFIFRELLLCGRFAYGETAVTLPWSVVVDDPNREDDLFDILSNEFDRIWDSATHKPDIVRTGGSVIFVSYASEDKPSAEALCAYIREQMPTGETDSIQDIFLAFRDVSAGDDWRQRLRHKLQRANTLVILWSPNSKNSSWVVAEMGAAWFAAKRKRKIIIVRQGTVVSDLPEFARDYQSIVWPTESSKLIEALSTQKP